MKTFKKLLPLAAASMMAFGTITPAFAASITVDPVGTEEGTYDPEVAATYKAYRVFDAKGENGKYSYTINSDSPFFATFYDAANKTSLINGIELTQSSTDPKLYVVTANENFNDTAEAKALTVTLRKLVEDTSIDFTGYDYSPNTTSGKPVFEDLPTGYYFVTTNSGALCNLKTASGDVTIVDKNPGKTINKEMRKRNGETFPTPLVGTTMNVGDIVGYVVDTTVPDTTHYDTYKFKVNDEMSNGLDFVISKADAEAHKEGTTPWSVDKSVVVKVGGNVLDEQYYEATLDKDNHKLVVDFSSNIKNVNIFPVGAKIEIEYEAKINETAKVTNFEKNEAYLEYSTKFKPGGTGETKHKKTYLYDFDINILKTNEDGSTKLEGAKFALYKLVNGEKSYYKLTKKTDSEGNEYDFATWVSKVEDATIVTTDSTGNARFSGLEFGTYYLEETEPPFGYNILTSDVKVTLRGLVADENGIYDDGTTKYSIADGTKDDQVDAVWKQYEINGNANDAVIEAVSKEYKGTAQQSEQIHADPVVPNTNSPELPETGGMGTTIFTIAGATLMAGAFVVIVTKRRVNSNN